MSFVIASEIRLLNSQSWISTGSIACVYNGLCLTRWRPLVVTPGLFPPKAYLRYVCTYPEVYLQINVFPIITVMPLYPEMNELPVNGDNDGRNWNDISALFSLTHTHTHDHALFSLSHTHMTTLYCLSLRHMTDHALFTVTQTHDLVFKESSFLFNTVNIWDCTPTAVNPIKHVKHL